MGKTAVTLLIRNNSLSEQETVIDAFAADQYMKKEKLSPVFRATVGLLFNLAGEYLRDGRVNQSLDMLDEARYLAINMCSNKKLVDA